eukprot:4957580-Pyramimonas_sp.AAC.1
MAITLCTFVSINLARITFGNIARQTAHLSEHPSAGADQLTGHIRPPRSECERGAERVSCVQLVECSDAHACARPVEGA